MKRESASQPSGSPWREPIVWLMIVLVAASVLGSVQLLRVSLRDGPVDAVADEVRRTGQAQMADLGPDERAAAAGLAAIVRVDRASSALEVLAVSGPLDRTAPLRLHLRHPLRAAEDLSVQLAPGERGWRVSMALPQDHDWLLQLSPGDGSWRLLGRLPKGQLAAHLAPAVLHHDAVSDDAASSASAHP
jgi:hypothetical protein